MRVNTHAAQPSLLAGLVFDEMGVRMTPSHAKKGSRRHRYYVGKTTQDQPLRIPASELEEMVIEALVAWLNDESRLLEWLAGQDASAVKESLRRAHEVADQVRAEPRGAYGQVFAARLDSDRLDLDCPSAGDRPGAWRTDRLGEARRGDRGAG